jgi:epsilon-lactone hydrolase
VRSTESHSIDHLYRWYRKTVDEMLAKAAADGTMLSMADFRKLSFFTLTPEPQGVTFEEVDAGGVPCIWADAVGGRKDAAFVFFHGGGFIHGAAADYKAFCGHLAKYINARVLIVDYRLAPEHVFPAQLDDAETAYRWLLKTLPADRIAVGGDSAGGGLALSLLLALKLKSAAYPRAAVLMSAWLDLTSSNPSLKAKEGIDVLVTQEAGVFCSQTTMGGADPANPLASPVFGDYAGITTDVYMQVGGAEVLQGENDDTASALAAGGVNVELEIFPEMQHVFQQGVTLVPEADEAMEKVARFLQARLSGK